MRRLWIVVSAPKGSKMSNKSNILNPENFLKNSSNSRFKRQVYKKTKDLEQLKSRIKSGSY